MITAAEANHMSIKELAAARWRAEAMMVLWTLVALDSALDVYRDMFRPPYEPSWWAVTGNVVGVVYGIYRVYRNNEASEMIRRCLHALRSSRSIVDRLRN